MAATQGDRVQIFSSHIKKMLCQGSGNTPVGGINLSCRDKNKFDDDSWRLVPGRFPGFYLIVHDRTGNRLYANIEREEIGLIQSHYYQYEDQHWQIRRQDEGTKFQLVNYFRDAKLFLRDHAEPHVGVCAGDTIDYPDQYFEFIPETPVMPRLDGDRFQIASCQISMMLCQGIGNTPVGGVNVSYQDKNNVEFDSWKLVQGRVPGYYLIIHAPTGNRLYANIERNEIGLIQSHYYQYDDQHWQIKWYDDNRKFQLVNYFRGAKMFLRDHAEPHLGICAGNTINYPDQYFKFIFETPDEKECLDLHETCDNGHSMHHFHGRPVQKDRETRYSPTCRVCSKEALENQPYFMHCFQCEYDVCSACAKLEVHFDQIERTTCNKKHAMKIHRGYLQKGKPVACDACCEETALEKAPYFFHCLKCNENKCITCSRHDIYAKHKTAGFMDKDDNFAEVVLEFNDEKMRNELHLYTTPWDAVESAPAYVREVKCIKLNLSDRSVAFDDDTKNQVKNVYDTYDSWKEFVIQVVPLAKIAHVRVEFYNTHINKSGYPVYKDSAKGDAHCGRPIIGHKKRCEANDQCGHCKHFTKKVKAKPKHSWWSGFWSKVGSVASGVLDSIPVVGHIKGAVEYALGYKEAAKESFEAATRTTVVMGAGVAGFALGGPAGAIGAGIGAGLLFDTAATGIDSAIHKKWTPHGEMKQFSNIVQGKGTWWDYASLGLDVVFDGLGGADGALIFKDSIKEGIEKGMAGEVERDFDIKTAERTAEKEGPSAVSGGTERPIPEFPPERRVDYHLREFHWTNRGTGLEESDPMFREIYEELEHLPKDDLEVRYGTKEDWTEGLKPWWYYDNTAGLKYKSAKTLRTGVSDKLSAKTMCEVKQTIVKQLSKHPGIPRGQVRNIDHVVECQLHAKISSGVNTQKLNPSNATLETVSNELRVWQNSEDNLCVLNAEMNIWKRDATRALMRGELADGTKLTGKNAYKTALMYHNFTSAQADIIIAKVKLAFRRLKIRGKALKAAEQKVINSFIARAKQDLWIRTLGA